MTTVDIPDPMNAADLFVDENLRRGREGKVAVYYQDREITYARVGELVNRTGNGLRELGVRMEERVMLLLVDCPEFVYAFFGAIKIGAVPVPVNTMLKPHDYEYLVNDSRGRVLVVSEALLAQIEPVRSRLRYVRHIVVVGRTGQPRDTGFEDMVRAASAELDPEPMSKDDPCFWLYSSGTTGFPKGAVHLQHDMVYCAELFGKQVLGLTEMDRTFSVAKLFFAYGLGNSLYFPFRVGASTVLYPGKPDPVVHFETIERRRPTVFFAVPTAYAAMLALPDAERKYDTSSLRLCVSAGEMLPAALWERWQERFGTEILDGIGSTEVLHIFISNRPGRCKAGSSGELVPGYDARIVDSDGAPVPRGQVGDLLVKGESTCALYWNQHAKTKSTMEGDWIRTGDKYIRDEDGYFWYQGRSDDMLKVGGIWVSPVEIESALVAHPAVLECGVVGAEDADQLVKPKAYVVLKSGHPDSAETARELQAFVRERLAAYKYPRWVEFVSELPKTATGKIQRFKLRT